GKSSLINTITGQNLAVVSDVAGTTTDPVSKAMELLPLGPVLFIDTPGLDDVGELGEMRVAKSYQAMNKTDIALLAVDSTNDFGENELTVIKRLNEKNIPFIIVITKSDKANKVDIPTEYKEKTISVSSKTGENINELKELIAKLRPTGENPNRIVADLLQPNDFVVLVVPIDSAAPKGRLILPQQQTIRDILDSSAVSVVTRDTELEATLKNLGQSPKLVITDSQAFGKVSKIVPENIPLTSFSILFARYKGNLQTVVNGAKALETLIDGDKILISEGCTHHRQCEDIGTVKLPKWIEEYTGKKFDFKFTSGTEFPVDLSPYKLIVHCGGCTLNEREMKYRLRCANEQNIPITNYGILISYMQKILMRCINVFPEFSN
ncbi:MAG: [FeFe] hydrogenase H-cluster maturation GTPase HydF, partial [Spirochaetota bacterium]|nr:[FeFe] hydrogenase H-cluster maturation GTPase HydF [Spirochaetota bacterium]